MSHHRLEAKDLYFKYPDGHIAVNGMSFLIKHGESVGIIGANGAGKSTLLMLLLGILFADKGEIILGDMHITKNTLPLIRERMGMVFSNPDDQLFMNTVYEDVAFGPRNYKLSDQEVEERVSNALDMVNIKHLRDRMPYRLSSGEKRAAAIATVMSMNPDVLIMDEPSSALDPKARRTLINLLKGFTHTKLVASHDLDMIYELCDRTIIISGGKIEADGKTKEILENEELLLKCNLELPFILQSKNNF